MPEYAVVRNGQFIEQRSYAFAIPPEKIKNENGVPQLRPYAEVVPSVDPATEVRDGPTYTIANDLVTATWTKRSKTAAELDADKDSRVAGISDVLFRIAFNHENRIRTLAGQATVTQAQFRAAVKALL